MASPTNGNGGETPAAPPPPQGQTPGQAQFRVVAQYSKDFSFENPNAPRTYGQQQAQPAINIQINVSANNATETDYEVVLSIEGKAETSGTLMFSFELVYAGIFRIQNIPQESLHPFVMIECPRLLFPFARNIIASATRDAGYPPLLLDPIDFVGLYRQNLARQQAQGAATPAS
jgi:preprotein translocase subunit SecB